MGFGDRLLEGEVLQAMKGVVMDKRGDRSLAGQQVAEMVHLVLEVVAHLVGNIQNHLYSLLEEDRHLR